MRKSIATTVVLSLLAAAIAGAPKLALAQSADTGKTGTEKKETPKSGKQRATPFRGKIGAIDKNAMTFAVGERTFVVTSTTHISKNGKPATLADVAVGDEVGGTYTVGDAGKLEVQTVRIGAKPGANAKGEKKAETKAE